MLSQMCYDQCACRIINQKYKLLPENLLDLFMKMNEGIKEHLRAIVNIYRNAVKIKAGPVSPSCGLLLFIFAYALSKSREKITAVDVGAGVGVSTAFLATGINGRVYAIEKNKKDAQKYIVFI